MPKQVTIYHNPKCGTSRNALALLREKGIEPVVIEYLKQPPTRSELKALLEMLRIPARDLLRTKEKEYSALGLDSPKATEGQILEAISKHPILLQRPIVVVDERAAICRPVERAGELIAGS